MAEFWFYHMTESRLEDALPRLVERSIERGIRVAIQTGSTGRRDALDTLLWTYREDSFLPHGTDECDQPEHQPILLTCRPDNINRASIRFYVDGAEPGAIEDYDRAVLMFDGLSDDEIGAARQYWKKYRDGGHSVSYWQQDRDGRWSRKA